MSAVDRLSGITNDCMATVCHAVTSPAAGSLLCRPGNDGLTARKASSSSSCDSVCTAVSSSRCSSCSDVPPPSLTDSGNGSSDVGVEHFWFPNLLSNDPANSLDRVRPVGGTASASYCLVANFIPEWDAERLETVYGRLAQCGFYYGRLSVDGASERLRRAPVGTFLLRDSADERHLLAISVQTCRGTTSIRLLYHAGLFRMDCSQNQEHLMPTFDCALRLVVHYVRRTSAVSSYVLVETSGRRDTAVVLRRPLYWRVDRLSHLCRRAVHRALSHGPAVNSQSHRDSVVDRLQLVPSLRSYLKDYPYEL